MKARFKRSGINESINSDGFVNDEELQKYFQDLGDLPDEVEIDGIEYKMEQYGGSGDNAYVIYTDVNNDDSYIKVFYTLNKTGEDSYEGIKEIKGVSDLRESKKITESESSLDGKDVTNDFQMMKAFTSNFGPVKIIKNSYDKNYYIYKADETDSKNYIDFSKNKDYIEGWLSGAIKANNKIINSVTESVEGQDILTTLKQRKNAIIRLITKYDDVGDEDKIKDLNKKLQQVEIDIENYSNPDKPMIMSNLEESNTEGKRIPTEDLPDLCYGYNHTTQEIIILKKGVMGYYPSKVNLDNLPEGTDRDKWAEDYVKEQNEILGVTEEQAQQMQINSMFGWEDTKMESKKLKTEVTEVGGEDISIDSIFHFPNVIEAMQETCREAIYELQNETNTPVTEADVRVIYNSLDELQDKVNKYLEKANSDEDLKENKKLNESIHQFIIGLTNKSVKELIEDETYDSYVKDIKAKDNEDGVEIELTDNKEEALKFENKIDAEIAASEVEQIQNDFSTVIVIAL